MYKKNKMRVTRSTSSAAAAAAAATTTTTENTASNVDEIAAASVNEYDCAGNNCDATHKQAKKHVSLNTKSLKVHKKKPKGPVISSPIAGPRIKKTTKSNLLPKTVVVRLNGRLRTKPTSEVKILVSPLKVQGRNRIRSPMISPSTSVVSSVSLHQSPFCSPKYSNSIQNCFTSPSNIVNRELQWSMTPQPSTPLQSSTPFQQLATSPSDWASSSSDWKNRRKHVTSIGSLNDSIAISAAINASQEQEFELPLLSDGHEDIVENNDNSLGDQNNSLLKTGKPIKDKAIYQGDAILESDISSGGLNSKNAMKVKLNHKKISKPVTKRVRGGQHEKMETTMADEELKRQRVFFTEVDDFELLEEII